MASGKHVAYYRVSTHRQGRSGLGLEAQRQAVLEYLNGGQWQLRAEFTEVESGAFNERPELKKALAACRVYGATLVVSKLDRLARDAHFLLTLKKEGVKFVIADLPQANDLTVDLLAVLSQYERKLISERTRAALAAAKSRGVKLGRPENLERSGRRKGTSVSAVVRGAAADRRATDLALYMLPLRDNGASLREIARELEALEIPTPRGGGKWTPTAVKRVLERIAA